MSFLLALLALVASAIANASHAPLHCSPYKDGVLKLSLTTGVY